MSELWSQQQELLMLLIIGSLFFEAFQMDLVKKTALLKGSICKNDWHFRMTKQWPTILMAQFLTSWETLIDD